MSGSLVWTIASCMAIQQRTDLLHFTMLVTSRIQCENNVTHTHPALISDCRHASGRLSAKDRPSNAIGFSSVRKRSVVQIGTVDSLFI